jgi:thioesterase domain-containing protein
MDLTRASGVPTASGPGEDWGDLVTSGAKIAERLAAEFGLERLERLQAVFKANFLALASYSPKPYAGRPVLIRAQGHVAEGLFDSTMGWSALATEGVTTHVLPGDHYSLLKTPTVEALAKIVEAETRQPPDRRD